MNNITANKISLNGEILLDLTQDTATEADVAVGKTFHKADGTPSVGALIPKEDLDAELTEQETLIAELKNTLLNGGGGNSDEWIGDGKTHLWIEIATEGRMDVPLYFYQNISNGVTIDWGDGSASQALSGKGNVNTTHAYASIGKYIITLDASNGCTLLLGHDSSQYCVMGSIAHQRYRNMLKRVEIGNSVTQINGYAFRDCYSLSSIKIPNSVTFIGASAFSSCYSLSNIEIPNSVINISQYAFDNCYSSNIKIPNSVTSIGASAFSGCRLLSNIEIPNSVINISQYAFSGCYSLSNIEIPNSVTQINGYAFNGCYSLSNIEIPNSVTSIGGSAFNGCYSMEFYDFTKHTAIPTLSDTKAFQQIPSDCEIRVPLALVDEWKAATNWSTYASNIVGV